MGFLGISNTPDKQANVEHRASDEEYQEYRTEDNIWHSSWESTCNVYSVRDVHISILVANYHKLVDCTFQPELDRKAFEEQSTWYALVCLKQRLGLVWNLIYSNKKAYIRKKERTARMLMRDSSV